MSTTTVRRVARKPHLACGGYCPPIQPGDVYLEHKVFPGDDVMEVPHPIRLMECADCARRYGRAELLDPPVQGQLPLWGKAAS